MPNVYSSTQFNEPKSLTAWTRQVPTGIYSSRQSTITRDSYTYMVVVQVPMEYIRFAKALGYFALRIIKNAYV